MTIFANRLRYLLSPQFDVYELVAKMVEGRVLDVGFGTGFGCHLLAMRADELLGVETNADCVNFARRAFPNDNARFELGDITEADAKRIGTFDWIVMIDVLEHIERDARALKCAAKLLRTDGTFVCSTPNAASRYRKSDNHVREYTPESLTALLAKYFKNVKLRSYGTDALSTGYENPLIALVKKVKSKK